MSGGADLLRSVPPEPTQSTPESPAARRVWEGRARWRRCLSVTDRCGSASSSRLANRTLLSQTEPLPIFRQALRNVVRDGILRIIPRHGFLFLTRDECVRNPPRTPVLVSKGASSRWRLERLGPRSFHHWNGRLHLGTSSTTRRGNPVHFGCQRLFQKRMSRRDEGDPPISRESLLCL